MVGGTLRQLDSHTENYNIQHLIGVVCYILFVTVCYSLCYSFVDLLNTNRIHTNVHTKGLQNLMAKCTRSFLSSLNDQTVTIFELKTFYSRQFHNSIKWQEIPSSFWTTSGNLLIMNLPVQTME